MSENKGGSAIPKESEGAGCGRVRAEGEGRDEKCGRRERLRIGNGRRRETRETSDGGVTRFVIKRSGEDVSTRTEKGEKWCSIPFVRPERRTTARSLGFSSNGRARARKQEERSKSVTVARL